MLMAYSALYSAAEHSCSITYTVWYKFSYILEEPTASLCFMEDGDKFFQNVGKCLPDYLASLLRREYSTQLWFWETEVSHKMYSSLQLDRSS